MAPAWLGKEKQQKGEKEGQQDECDESSPASRASRNHAAVTKQQPPTQQKHSSENEFNSYNQKTYDHSIG